MAAKQSWIQNIRSVGWESMVPIIVVGMVFVMLVPLPGFVLDLLLSLSITASVLVLLTALQLVKPVEFSVFPSLILLLTLFRLSLDLASSRRILLHGSEGVGAAGSVIEAFGKFVVGGNYVVGFVLFIALIAIQFLVISHGAVRTAEVTARFTLDAMPGKQMAIDADMSAGLINEAQARARRAAIAHEAEFYGAMDGAARFSQRDSMATILITAINIVAGFLIGVLQQGVPFAEALKTYTVLTVGHGLVTMIPSLLVSVAGGVVLTRASSEGSLDKDLSKQLLSSPKPIMITSGVLLALAMIPGLPKTAFLLISGGLYFGAKKIKKAPKADEGDGSANGEPKQGGAPGQSAANSEPLDAAIKLDELMLEVGLGLVPMVDAKQGGQLLGKIRSIRKSLAQQLGFLVPSIHITDNIALKEQEYVVYLRGVEISRWELRRDSLLAICSEATPPPLAGIETKDPAFNVGAKWISPAQQAQALASGYAVVDRTSVLATHLSELIKQNAHDLLTRQETKRLTDRIGETHPKLVDELIPKLMTLGEVQKILQQLLREQVSIRDLGTILEVLVDMVQVNKNPVLLVEAVRQALSRGIVRGLLDESGALKVVTLNAALEEECSRAAVQQAPINNGTLQVSVARRVLEALKVTFGEQVVNTPPILMCSSPGRFYLRRMLEPFLPKVVVISPTEVPPIVPVQAVGSVR